MDFRADCADKTDEQIVPLVFDNAHYFGCLMERYENKLRRYVMRISNVDAEQAQDILQEVFLKAYRNLRGFDTALKFSSWIYRIAHNQAISAHRRSQARPQTISLEVDDNFLENIASDFDTARQADLKILRQNITFILDKLPAKYRDVLILKYFEQKDYHEMSDILQKPIGTVGTLLNRAKKQFAQELTNCSLDL